MYRDEEKVREEIWKRQSEFKNDVRWVMSSRRGRRLMFWIVNSPNPLVAIENTNAIAMAIFAGRSRVTGDIVKHLQQICPDEELLMRKENEVTATNHNGENDDD